MDMRSGPGAMKRKVLSFIAELLRPFLLVFFYHVPVAAELVALRFRKTCVKARFDGAAEFSGGRYAVFVVYELGRDIPISVQNILQALQGAQVNTLLMSNTALTEAQLDYLKGVCWKIVVRDNTGFDFGAYKDGVSILRERTDIARVTLLNDSVFFLSRGLDALIDRTVNARTDLCAAFENWERKYHLQSFFISMNGRVFHDSAHLAFWDGYRPVSNRRWSIKKGELALSTCLLNTADSMEVFFSNNDLVEKLLEVMQSTGEPARRIREKLYFSQLDRDTWDKVDFRDGDPDRTLSRIVSFMHDREKSSQIHMRGFESFLLQGSPLIKKDIVFRHYVRPWAFEHALGDSLDEGELEQILLTIKQRDLIRNLGPLDRLKCRIGVK